MQAHLLAETDDLPARVRRALDETCEWGGCSEDATSRPLPVDTQRKIELVRMLHRDSGQWVGNVLDVTGVSGHGGLDAWRFQEDEIRRFCTTDRPTIQQAKAAAYKINEMLVRGAIVCSPL